MSSTTSKRFLAQQFRGRSSVACFYCERATSRDVPMCHPHRATVDHRVARAKGGEDRVANMVICCYECNHRKGPLSAAEYVAALMDGGRGAVRKARNAALRRGIAERQGSSDAHSTSR